MNCIVKLWTSILTSIGTQTAESEGVFSDTAYGFRSHRNIYDILSTHIMMYEDAQISKKKHIHGLLGLQECIRRNGPPNPLATHERIWFPRLLHCSVQATIFCLKHILHDHTRQHGPTLHLQRYTPKRPTIPLPLYYIHGTTLKMASYRQPRI